MWGREGEIQIAFFFCSQCKVYSRYIARILSCPQALSVLCYSCWLKKGSLPFMHTGDCSTGERVCFLAKLSTWTDVEKFKKIVTHRRKTRLSRNPPFLLPVLKMWKSAPLKLLQSRMGHAQEPHLGAKTDACHMESLTLASYSRTKGGRSICSGGMAVNNCWRLST